MDLFSDTSSILVSSTSCNDSRTKVYAFVRPRSSIRSIYLFVAGLSVLFYIGVICMSDKEMAINIINSLPESQLGYVVNMLENFRNAIAEAADDAFCEQLYNDYLNDPDPEKDDGIPIEDLAKSLGIQL